MIFMVKSDQISYNFNVPHAPQMSIFQYCLVILCLFLGFLCTQHTQGWLFSIGRWFLWDKMTFTCHLHEAVPTESNSHEQVGRLPSGDKTLKLLAIMDFNDVT